MPAKPLSSREKYPIETLRVGWSSGFRPAKDGVAAMTPRHLRSALAALAMLAMTVGLTPASGATVTCVKSQEVTDEEWGDPFVKRLRDQGLTRSDHPICGAAMLTGKIRPGDARKIDK